MGWQAIWWLCHLTINVGKVVGDQRPKKDPALDGVLLTTVESRTADDPMSAQKWLNC